MKAMKRSLTLKLVLAFLLVSIAGAGLAALFTRWAISREFEGLVLEQAESDFIQDVTAYYEAHGEWTGAAAYLGRRRRCNPDLSPRANQLPRHGQGFLSRCPQEHSRRPTASLWWMGTA